VKRVRIRPLPRTAIAEDKDEARKIREEIILPSLRRGERVVLDFDAVDLATQSFIHALVSDAIRRYGDQALELIDFRNCSDELKQLVLTVVEYTYIAIEAAEKKTGEPQ
jgi:hypothetical protein